MTAAPRVLRLHPDDNIAVAATDLRAGEKVEHDGVFIIVERDTPIGHKIAIRAIAPGERVMKYRVPIGSATQAIAPGAYVHTHNLKSDYIATYTLEGARPAEEER